MCFGLDQGCSQLAAGWRNTLAFNHDGDVQLGCNSSYKALGNRTRAFFVVTARKADRTKLGARA